MTIGELAGRAGLTTKTVRYYEQVGLLPPPSRTSSGYRRYGDDDVVRLQFIGKAKRLGLSLEEIRGILAISAEGRDPCPHVVGLLDRHLARIDETLAGLEIRFIHTEASDGQVAAMLTQMMGSPVLVVPSLAQVPASALAKVYVFMNGIKGEGPFGSQPDVFDSAPDRGGYSPLRALQLVTWKDPTKARLLRSVDEVKAAETAGEVAVERPGTVVNMPLLTWPGGQR